MDTCIAEEDATGKEVRSSLRFHQIANRSRATNLCSPTHRRLDTLVQYCLLFLRNPGGPECILVSVADQLSRSGCVVDHSRRVALIVADDDFFRLALRAILQDRLGFACVIEAANLNEAMVPLSMTAGITLALMDFGPTSLHDVAGLKTICRQLPRTRIVALSTCFQKRDIYAGLDAGIQGYVPKTIGCDAVTRALKLVLEGIVYVPSSVVAQSFSEELEAHDAETRSDLLGSSLTKRQREVLELLVQGYSNKVIAKALGLSQGTIKIHVAALFRAFQVNARAALAVAGARLLASTMSDEKTQDGESGATDAVISPDAEALSPIFGLPLQRGTNRNGSRHRISEAAN